MKKIFTFLLLFVLVHTAFLKTQAQSTTRKCQAFVTKAALLLLLSFFSIAGTFAHTVDYFTTCPYVCAGSTLTVNARVSLVNSSSRYNWQYKDNSNTWKCFVNGNNTINGVVFSVSGATASGQLSNGPVLTIPNAGTALSNVYVRLLIADGSSPCTASTTWGQDKNLQLHVLTGGDCANLQSYCGSGERCFKSCTNDARVSAKTTWNINRAAGTVTIRVTLPKTFVDNTYGANTIGWPGGGGAGNHKFEHLVTSDNLQLALYNGSNSKVLDFKMDYFSQSSSKPSGYGTSGVTSNDGGMISGSASNIVQVRTSLDENFNTYGYKLTSNSPATDATYKTNSTYPNWIYDVWYEATVKLSAFGSSGFGTVTIPSLHASPSKTGKDIECLTPDSDCIPDNLTLGNLVWNDINANGMKDSDEPGVGGVTVKLYRDNNGDNVPDVSTPIATTTTNSSGTYLFTNLSAGKYIAGVVIPEGYIAGPVISTSSNPDNNVDNDNNGVSKVNGELRSKFITLSAGSEPTNDGDGSNGNLTLDFAICGQGNLGDFVWNDLNNNGIQDTNEPGISNVTVTLTFPDGTARTTVTDANGNYKFVNLGPVTHKVTFATPPNYSASPANQGGDDAKDSDPVNGSVTVTLAPNQDNYTIDAGFNTASLSLGNLVWNDANGNGLKEVDEAGISGIITRLYRDNNGDNRPDGQPIATTTTAVDGTYKFNNLAAGKYIVGIVIPSGFSNVPVSFANPNDDKDNDNNGINLSQAELRTNFITLAPGTEPTNDGDGNNSNLTLDLAICGSANLGDFVWNDLDNDGIQDADEPGIAGAIVKLTFPDGTVATRTTDASGKYLFVNLGPGTYTVTFTTPAGFGPSPANQGTDDAKDSDPVNGVVTVTLGINTVNLTVDAGFCQPGNLTLGNLVWNDWNGNGLKEAGEPGVAGVVVRLYKDNNGNNIADGNYIETTTTGQDGTYMFDGLTPGNYIVGVVIPSGFTITGTSFPNPNDNRDNDNNGTNVINQAEYRTNHITLSTGAEPTDDGDDSNGNLTLDIGICGRGSIGDFVWNDSNANGIQDAGEAGIPGVTVTLTFPDGTTTTSTTTDANGKYLFINLGTGTHTVTFTTPSGFNPSPSNQGTNDAKDSDPVGGSVLVTLDAVEDDLTIDAGFTKGAVLSLGNFVWNDSDGDGKRDPNEYGIGGITVSLYRDANNDNLPDGASIASTQTNSQGFYSFTGLTEGNYIASIPVIPGYVPGGQTSTSVDPDNNVDNDNNAIRAVGPVGAQELFTNAITLLAGTEPTDDGDGSNGNTTLDLALCGNSWIGDFVWNDLNVNGIQDAGEPGINGVEVTLTAADGTVRTEYTRTYVDPNAPAGVHQGDGYYDFGRLGPGTYTVTFKTPAGYEPTVANQGSNDALDSDPVNGVTTVTLAPNQSNFTIDAGYTQPGTLTLGNFVWNDLNFNGFREANEPGIGDVPVRLYRDNNNDNVPDGVAIATTTTSTGGYYNFTGLNQGRYIVGVIIPSGYTITPVQFDNPDNNVDNDNNGTNVINEAEFRTNGITLLQGTEPTNDGDDANGNLTLDIGLCGRSNIGDFVWFDKNNNGIQDAGEPGMPGVKVTITFEEGTTRTEVTDANGKYTFINVGPGTFPITFQTPFGYTPSPANQGQDDAIDSDPINGTVTVTVAPNEDNYTIDAGYWDDIDDDDDGITDLDESGGIDPLKDCDNDGIPNYKDPTPGCVGLVWSDCPSGTAGADGINDFFDFDRDGIINALDLDSDNDGVLDVQETRDPRAVDANADGMVDGVDADGDGLLSTADTNDNVYGGPGLSQEDMDRDGNRNFLDLDSDGDGLSDLTEATQVFDNDGLANGEDTDGDGVRGNYSSGAGNADTFEGFGARGVALRDKDGDGKPNPYDIDSDNDGITDNVEGQPTCSEKQPSGVDVDRDGLDDVYDTNLSTCPPKGAGITPYDKDGDGTPDIYDLDTDNDNAPDVNEGSGIFGNFVTLTGDTDGDGLIDQFDIFNIKTATASYTQNVGHREMGPNGNFDGPAPGGSNARLPKSKPGGCAEGTDRDWRDVSILAVTLIDFKGNMNNGKVALTWITTNESNMSHYIVERSINGSTYAEVGKVNSKGNNNNGNFTYNLNDDVSSLTNATVYYRLKQVEKGGSEELSNVITFKLNNRVANALAVHPNPATSYFTVKVNTARDGMATIRITDFAGRVVVTQNHKLSMGSNAVTFNNLINMGSGTYNVQVLINGEVLNEKLVIVK